ncbi:mismatch-specific DNA-glycosylase [Sporomusa acidovorans]|uniref:G/U mismatch-specific DNA glycosylase n=1 Tax=Sporomusa acidovorans (strain ATCC 49682 / DSM 3132 / Mol) TaxID=1123286 RepID=A0ABZ3IVI2_SPOA4|nr:mismatch-specific DNA-glycosylase [Sporomusa acidovorans]OZC15267.1 G/U mismatch-specific DNA glycosylase [Sporomusa acidovorans DSM 3132]SDE91634.1 G/U mismatch-specific uracil-DNA glycosylase [Sporomusa acidovorans]
MNQVPDIIASNLKILFIGFNPGNRSAETGHHFAGYSNKFWKLLAAAGFTPYQFTPEEDGKLLNLGLGITNIVARPSRTAAEISKEEYQAGRVILREKLLRYKPQVACFAGVGVYREFSGQSRVSCGRQAVGVVAGVSDFVVPSPSGLTRIVFAEQLAYYQELKRLVGANVF